MTTLGQRLRACGVDPAGVVAHRIVLHPDDAVDEFLSTAALAGGGHALAYQRMQDGPAFGCEALVAAFVETAGDRAAFAGLRRLVARRPGVAPGDIVYDPDLSHLLHTFIGRALAPVFYDAFDDDRGAALVGLVVGWPQASAATRRADDADLRIIEP